MSGTGTVIVEAKCAPPVAPDRLVPRPRLLGDFKRLISAHRVVDITATAGSGKTTTVASAVGSLDRPVAWLTLDDTDTAPGRLLTYLEATVSRSLEDFEEPASAVLGRGLAHPEAASILAEEIGDEDLVIVIDEVERLAGAPEAQAVLSSLIRHSRPGVRFVLIGRRRVYLDAMSRIGLGEVGRLDEQMLAFTPDEAATALEIHGAGKVDPGSVVVSVGGWVAGVLFEAWRSRDHVAGSGGEHDPLAGYLATQILEQLDDEEQEFLVLTSVLDEVDRETAEALGAEDAGEMMHRLRAAHLPATWRDEGALMRCHPRFRDHLRGLLEQAGAERVADVKWRHANLLSSSGRHEEAVEELLALGREAEAAEIAEAAFEIVVARQDFADAERWLVRFEAAGLGDHPAILSAQLSISTAVEKFGRGVASADRLFALATSGEAPAPDPEQKALAAWCYWHVGRLDDARVLLADAGDTGIGEAIRYLFTLVDDEPPARLPAATGGPLDALVLRISFVRGRLREVRDAPVSLWTPATTERAGALRALGELRRTEELLSAARSQLSNLRFEGTVATELMIDLGDEHGAREALARGRERISRSGSFVFDMVLRLLEAKLELRLNRDATTGLAVLEEAARSGPIQDYGYLVEQLDLWRGYAHLMQDRDVEAAAALGAAVRRMAAADRILELPAAAVYFAEANWRLGEEAESDAAADSALSAADRSGSRHLLLLALRDVPGVLARQMDSEAAPDGPWHELSRAMGITRQAPRGRGPTRITLDDLGPPRLVIDGEGVRARLSKSYALLAFLIESGGAARRTTLLESLFDGHSPDSAGAYLRQAAHGLRQVLPDGMELRSAGGEMHVEDVGAISAKSDTALAELEHAAKLTGTTRIVETRRALEAFEAGEYLEGIECAWASSRREHLVTVIVDAKLAMAVAAFEVSQFDLAEDALRDVVGADPYRERAWRLLMRVAAARGSEGGVLEAFRGCEQAMGDAGLQPSVETQRLLAGLRS